mmetsp:Transcript_5440/g.13671  ORF Transcript_5440/g.13671 Transcript_5440/m.13671 type:complete len:351 (+) Transcript_5440:243-1295(+)|eukprot:CAMPEP_0197186158 /NCGR_PEP_ID=MMETSP1423-20130617/13319_1 /TAXON_ID=476441 /ORGANISM="Pseudo-nitzschia heimii, Strain UNC1101" /LENGTH=350 /DNA_ID=CAMNT_0042637387 /DNA_START=190 /DNA_END=1242 /DNA_ORIENTATION=-
MFSSSQIGGVHDSLSSQKAKQSPSSLPPTNISSLANSNHATFEEEKRNRTNDVRERLGPLIKKLKDGAMNIQALENSIRPYPDGNNDETGELNEEVEKNELRHTLSRRNSRRLMHESIEMVKKKMLRLKIMEEDLAALEERRTNLNHHFQQRLQKQNVPTDTSQYETRILELEEENSLLKGKSVLVDHLRIENTRLMEKTKDIEQLERRLDVEKSLRTELETSLVEHQHQMSQQVFKYNSLERKFNDLKSTIANAMKVLQSQENPNAMLEQSIKNLPETIGHFGTNDSFTTELMTLSSTESSFTNDVGAVENDDSSAVDKSIFRQEEKIIREPTVEVLISIVDTLNNEIG